ncbi:MAG: DUF2283 domain-containing protein [Candidatus Diapherotrites archaeon]|uniref:DUF2283 domain-containing protein n=1 Tax=Candidatus Iainarchaeum sp. TaxID=3101447 RepID=A0A8T4LBS8_9ARCH|nr:DUF2283 domain-containing protein [Candidatus Diapherotrites archaeon]
MKYNYDKETDTLMIVLSDKKPDFAEQEGDIITHYNKDHKPVEIEILNASNATIEILKAMLPARQNR